MASRHVLAKHAISQRDPRVRIPPSPLASPSAKLSVEGVLRGSAHGFANRWLASNPRPRIWGLARGEQERPSNRTRCVWRKANAFVRAIEDHNAR